MRDFQLSRATVIYNGVATSAIESNGGRGARGIDTKGHLELVFAGRIAVTKGAYTILEAMSLVGRQLDVSLKTYGVIDEPEKYASLKRQLGVVGRVVDMGFDPEWTSKIHRGQVFVLPSEYEGLPLALLEAMSCGLPVVASPVGGIPEIVEQPEFGILVAAGDAHQLAAVFQWLSHHPEEKAAMGLRGRRRIETTFSMGEMAARYVKLYLTLLGDTKTDAV